MSDTETKVESIEESAIKFDLAEINVLSLKPTDVLMVKLVGDYFMDSDMDTLAKTFKPAFPNNKVMVCVVPSGNDIQFEVVTKEEPINCSTAPKGYCDSCNCGKKEAAGPLS